MDNFKRLFVAGKLKTHEGALNLPSLWIEINFTDGKLSITGVHGPVPSGNCAGSCGQCTDTLRKLAEGPKENISPGVDAARLAEVWERWHLNDMRPNCEHMKRDHGWDPSKRLTIYKWKLKPEVSQQQRDIRKAAEATMLAGGAGQYSEADLKLLALEYWAYTEVEEPPSAHYAAESKETKAVGWLYPPESTTKPCFTAGSTHSQGLLTKPCPTCGYKYGSAWLREEVPQGVLEFLASLPHTPQGYPWGRK